MKVKQIFAYPIKSLRGVSLDSAILTTNGLPYDRKFMLVKIHPDATVKTMHVGHIAAMCLFTTALNIPDPENLDTASILVTYNPPSAAPRSITVPLRPSTENLDTMPITMHGSEGRGFVMESKYRAWFSECFGFACALLYVGEYTRPVLCSNPLNTNSNGSLLATIGKILPTVVAGGEKADQIAFQDCVPYLVVSEESCREVSKRLEGVEVDVTKFRPNIVVEGAEKAWEEDFWAEVVVGDAKIITAHNCGRCVSINVDYETGKYKTKEMPLKTLFRDRRVDTGHKYDPIFGRYSYLARNDDGKRIQVGDEVKVVKKNSTQTTFDWSGQIG